MKLYKANFLAFFASLALLIPLGFFFSIHTFALTDQEESLQKIYEETEKTQKESLHIGTNSKKELFIGEDTLSPNLCIESSFSKIHIENATPPYNVVEELPLARIYFKDKKELYLIDTKWCRLFYHNKSIEISDLCVRCYETPFLLEKTPLFTLVSDAKCLFTPNTSSFTITKNEKPICFTREDLDISASELTLEQENFSLKKLSFKKDVELHHRDMQGFADQIDYYPSEERTELFANEGSFVRFYNIKENSKIVAKHVIIEKDPLTKKESVRGVGRVELSLQEREYTNILDLIHRCTNSLF